MVAMDTDDVYVWLTGRCALIGAFEHCTGPVPHGYVLVTGKFLYWTSIYNR